MSKGLKEVNQKIQAFKERISEIYESEIKPRQECLKNLEEKRNEIILKSKFKWKGSMYKVADMQWYNNWHYDDCPYSPGYKSYTETLRIRPIEGRFSSFSLPDNEHGWYDKDHKEFKEFEDFFIDKFGVSFKMVLKEGEVKEL